MIFVCALSAAVLAQLPANAPVRIRGTVQSLDGTLLTVKGNDGQLRAVRLKEDYLVMGISKAGIDDIASGTFVGTTTLGERDGALVALEVHIFPENLRGTGEGHYDGDLRPGSKITNANVATVIGMGKDRMLEVRYKDGSKRVLVRENAVIVAYSPADRSAIKPGAPVFVNAQRQADGTLTAPRVNVGLNGQAPPM